MAASAPTNLPSGFTAPVGAVINQGQGNYTQGNGTGSNFGVPGATGNGNYLTGGPAQTMGNGPLPAGNLQSNGLPVGANINPGTAPSNVTYVGGFDPATESTPSVNTALDNVATTPITSSNLAPVTPTSYYTTTPTTTPSTAALGGDATSGTDGSTTDPTIQSAQDLSTQLEGLNNELAGKSTDIANDYAAAGYSVDSTGKPIDPTMADLNSQLANLKAQAGTIGGSIEANNIGRGTTAAGINPQILAAKNANAADTQIVAAQIAAKNNQMAYATTLINSAIQLKYGPIQDAITAATANLKLIESSPDYTAAEKAQAATTAANLATQKATVAQQVTDAKDVAAVQLEAAKNGADATTLQAIGNATDQASAIAAAGKYMQTPTSTATKTEVEDIGGNKVLINSDTGATIKVLGSSTATKTTVPSTAVNTIADTMQSIAGKDGYISPTDWDNALTEWTDAGYSQADFISNFQSYANLKDPTQHYEGLK